MENQDPPHRIEDLLAEIGKLHLLVNKKDEVITSLKGILSKLRNAGVVDQWNRVLPLPNHHKDCPHGQTGWAYCSCEELADLESEQEKACPCTE